MEVNSLSIDGASVVQLTSVDLPRVHALCIACAAFYELVEGHSPTEKTASDILGPLEPKYAHGKKHVWGVEMSGDLVAVTELLQDHPTSQEWYIGLLLVEPARRRRGWGTRFCTAILDWIVRNEGVTVRLLVHEQNVAAREFWRLQGFSAERELDKWSGRLFGRATVFMQSLRNVGK